MDDVQRLALLVARLVRCVQPLQHAGDDGADHGQRDRRARRPHVLEDAGERLAMDVLHHQEQLVLVADDVDRRHDVGVADARGEAGLVDQHGDELRIARQVRVQPLDGDDTGEAALASQPPEPDGGHAARRELTEKLVTIDDEPCHGAIIDT